MVRELSESGDQGEGREVVLVEIRHLRAVKYCAKGARPWFKRNGLNWTDFLDNGLLSTEFEKTGDPMVEPLLREARREVTSKDITHG